MSFSMVPMAHKPRPEEEALKEAAKQSAQRLQDALHRLQRKLSDEAFDADEPVVEHNGHKHVD